VGGGLARPHSADSARGANAGQSVGVRNVPAVPDGPGLSPHSIFLFSNFHRDRNH
jgi:hypothetical protein